jgi:hypothetical protein
MIENVSFYFFVSLNSIVRGRLISLRLFNLLGNISDSHEKSTIWKVTNTPSAESNYVRQLRKGVII